MKKLHVAAVMTQLFLLLFISCGRGENEGEDINCDNLSSDQLLHECIDKNMGKADRIDADNNPKLFGIELDWDMKELPTAGRVEKMPWPDTYWPTYQDSVNVRWQGSDVYSPLEKYDLAFNNWQPPAGFDLLRPFEACGLEFDQSYYTNLGPAAGFWSDNYGNKPMRDIWNDGDCYDNIPSWKGLCHAWTASAIMEPEPAGPVIYNGVQFDVSDMKALMIMMYDMTTAKFLGLRCEESAIERDDNGRVVDEQSQCRDTNPGSLHVILANMIGRDRRAFAEDRVQSSQVWNQPVVGFSTSYREISEEEATRLLDPDCEETGGCEYPYNDLARRFYDVETDVEYITESAPSTRPLALEIDDYIRTDHYHYILECNSRDKIIGGEWVGFQQHPDFLWLPLKVGPRPNPYVNLEKIRMLVRFSHGIYEEVHGFGNYEEVAIPDGWGHESVVSSITVDEDIEIWDSMVAVDITHEYTGDLVLTLHHGDQVVDLQRNAGGSAVDIHTVYYMDEFYGSARGNWELHVTDESPLKVGTLLSWELIVVSGEGSPPVAETFSNNTPVDIPNGDPEGCSNIISVDGGGVVQKLKVTVDIDHNWISDLVVVLKHGTGSKTLHNREGNNSDDIKKTYRIFEFINAAAEGDWELFIVDHSRQNAGTLNGWSLEITR